MSSACNNASKDYYLNINIDGTDQTPRRRIAVWNFLRKDVDEVTTGTLQANTQVIAPIVKANSQIIAPIINATSKVITSNLTATTGFFSYLGSLVDRITTLFVQNINVSGNLTGITKEVFYPVETSGNAGNFRTRRVGATGNQNFNTIIPDDFVSLVSVEAVGIVSGAGTSGIDKDIDLASNCVGATDLYTSNSVTDTTSTYTISDQNTVWEMNISSVFSNISAGDYCGINIDHNSIGGSIDYLGIKLKYKT